MHPYLQGTAVLGATFTTIPPAGQTYTDYSTVFVVQMKLKSLGFDPGPIDGSFGPKTAAAIKKMQASIGIPQTGVIDSGVLSALKVDAPERPLYQSPATKPAPFIPGPPPDWYSQKPNAPMPSSSLSSKPDFWSEPLWEGSKVKKWHAALGVAGGLAIITGVLVMRK